VIEGRGPRVLRQVASMFPQGVPQSGFLVIVTLEYEGTLRDE
jgi:hypothetical protein